MASPLDRVVQVVGRGPDNRPFFVASGLLLVGDLALTAAHALRDTAARYELRPVSPVPSGRPTAPLPVRRVVPHARRDLALLVLDTERGALPPLRFAELPYEMGQIPVHAVGFPKFTVEDSRPRSHQIDATVQLGSDRTKHQFQLSLQTSDPPAGAPGTSPWAGFSGAGILTKREGLLAGIATSHRPAGGQRNTTGTDLCDLADPVFLGVLAEHDVEPAPVPVRPATARPAGPAHWLPDHVWTVLSRQRKAADELPHRFGQDRRPRRLTAVYVRQLLSRQEAEGERAAGGPAEDSDGETRHPVRLSGQAYGTESIPGPPSALSPGPAPAYGQAKHTPSALASGPPKHNTPAFAPTSTKHTSTVGPPRRLEQVLAQEEGGPGHVLVEAGPGAGKSTLLHSCALDFGEAALASPTGQGRLVPLWVSATQLTDPGHSLESAVAAATGLDAGDGTLPRLPHGARWLVLVDALDEVHHDRRSSLIHRLADQAESDRPGGPRMLVTTRPDPEGTAELSRAGFQRYALDPFDRRRLEEFAHTWFKDSGRDAGPDAGEPDLATEFLRQIDDTGLSDLLRNPLLATVTAVVFESAGDRPLPDNRWALYEEYRAHLRATKHEQVKELWHDLTDRAAATRHGQHAVTQLRERVEELLGFLAYAQIADGARDLPQVAARWWEETATDAEGRHFGAAPPVDGWTDAITDALLGTGMFVRRGRDLEFLHTTFTEHLAAELLAERLPDTFDPDSRQWRTTIVAASGRSAHPLSELHRTALVHYGHRHRAGGQALLDWLQQGVGDDQLLAGELLAARCPAQDVHHQRFLAFMEIPRSPEMEEAAWGLLSRMRSARVTAYLQTSAHATGARRVWAATALMAHDAGGAARALREMAADLEVNPEMLHDAATDLAESHPEHRAEAAAALRAVLGHPRSDTWDRAAAAASLAALGGEYVAEVAEALMALIDGASPEEFGLEKAIEQLAGLGGEYEQEAARRIIQLTVAPGISQSQRLNWVDRLRELGETHYPVAALAYQAMADDPLTDRHYLREAISGLAELGGPYVEQAAQTLRAAISDPLTGSYDRGQSIRQLAELGEPYTAQAAPLLQAVVGDPDSGWQERMSCATVLAELGETYVEQAAWAWRTLIDDPEAPLSHRLRSASGLRLLGESYAEEAIRRTAELTSSPGADRERDQDPAISASRRVLNDRRTQASVRLHAAERLAQQGEPLIAEAAGTVGSILAESTNRAAQEDAAVLLLEWGEPYPDAAERSLRQRVAAGNTGSEHWLSAACGLLALGRLRLPTDTALLQRLLTDPSLEPRIRKLGVEVLRAAGDGYLDEFARVLGRALCDPAGGAAGRRAAADSLTRFGSAHVEKIASALSDVARQDTDPRARRDAARGLLHLGGPHVPLDTDALRAVVADRGTGLDERLRAIGLLLSLDREYATEAARVLYAVATTRNVEDDDFEQAVELLLGLGKRHRPLAMRALCTAIRRWHAGDLAAEITFYLGEPYTDMAARAIRRTVRPWTSADDREEMATALVRLGEQHKPYAARILRVVVRRPWADYWDRTHAAKQLAELGGPYVDMAAKALTRSPLGLWGRADNRRDLAEFLISLGEAHWPAAADVLIDVVKGRTTDSFELERAVEALIRLGDEFREPTLRALRRAARGRRLRGPFAYTRNEAAEALAALENQAPREPSTQETSEADLNPPPPAPPPPAAP